MDVSWNPQYIDPWSVLLISANEGTAQTQWQPVSHVFFLYVICDRRVLERIFRWQTGRGGFNQSFLYLACLHFSLIFFNLCAFIRCNSMHENDRNVVRREQDWKRSLSLTLKHVYTIFWTTVHKVIGSNSKTILLYWLKDFSHFVQSLCSVRMQWLDVLKGGRGLLLFFISEL